MSKIHTFHIPVMGTAFSIDTPIKVARYGISSVVSLVDDCLIEDMRRLYCEQTNEVYTPIKKEDPDYRARRITEYLNLMHRIVQKQFNELKLSAFEAGTEITKYFEMLPEQSDLKKTYRSMLETKDLAKKRQMQDLLRKSIQPGDINVNIMTKLDRINYAPDGQELPAEYSDALCALRGFAQSQLQSAIVFSAGINRRLYTYVEQFKDFYADKTGHIKKRIILKVSDYRSALIQGRFFAQKGIWVSEYRIESGLNCGGHAFATDGFLMGPILNEFKVKRNELIDMLFTVYSKAVQIKNNLSFTHPHPIEITAQGGIGTVQEDRFLREHYELDGTGWGSPFLLVPEVTNTDPVTLQKLADATENDLYLSDVSPLGVPFNNLRGSLSDTEKELRVQKGRPGSACPKGYLVSNTEFTEKPICSASRLYQKLKIDQLNKKNLDPAAYQQQFRKVIIKSCICNDLGESVLIKHHVPKNGGRFTAVCPGPNIAYFSKVVTLKEMVDHIYGRVNILNKQFRPHMFVKELGMYVDYLKKEIEKCAGEFNEKQIAYFNEFKSNLNDGIAYYQNLYPQLVEESQEFKQKMLEEVTRYKSDLENLNPLSVSIKAEALKP